MSIYGLSLVSLLLDSEGGRGIIVGGQIGGMSGQNVENLELVMIFDETQAISGLFQRIGKEGVILKSGGLAKSSLRFLESV